MSTFKAGAGAAPQANKPAKIELDPSLRDNVRLLGDLLGQTIRQHLGDEFFNTIEAIRQAAKTDRKVGSDELKTVLGKLSDDELVPVTRAFNQFLNLANIAEQYHFVRRKAPADELVVNRLDTVETALGRLLEKGQEPASILSAIKDMHIDFVLTAHPTEITRRTLIQKYDAITETLKALDRDDLLKSESDGLRQVLERLIAEVWHTDEIRQTRPTAVDEAKWGFSVIEYSLWEAVPKFYRQIDAVLNERLSEELPPDVSPLRFTSWMGGDRDGNPNVTHAVSQEVLSLSRWMAADLFLRDIEQLRAQLSMSTATDELRERVPGSNEPYRAMLTNLRDRLEATRHWARRVSTMDLPTYLREMKQLLSLDSASRDVLLYDEELLAPLRLCYDSLTSCGQSVIAKGPLLDTIYRLRTFGLSLVRLDIRQDSSRHREAVSEICSELGYGDYTSWSEAEKQAFLVRELDSKRPLLPFDWRPSDQVHEVLNTCRVIAAQPEGSVACYVISMASQPSDVLAVILLLRACGVTRNIPIVPLFETLSDLDGAAESIDRLLSTEWYKAYTAGYQQVMIGYSDSAKDGGQMAAAWAQYQTQEALVATAERHKVRLTLFHGRGGTVGRGGGPANRAILSQPPGSVAGRLRITEQGEMIRFKFGQPAVAVQSFNLYVGAVLEATLTPPPDPEPEWRETMTAMAKCVTTSYRALVKGNDDFVAYFRAATPEQELGKLALGSRPARRQIPPGETGGGVETLRAIPWIFAWTQMRLMLPAWLGSDIALQKAIDEGKQSVLEDMLASWPFFQTHIDMLEMVLAKVDINIAASYEARLVEPRLHDIGKQLRQRVMKLVVLVRELKKQDGLLADNPVFRLSLNVRDPYTDPLHYLQIELLGRDRRQSADKRGSETVEKALKVSMAGVAAGMRNTG
ncbi:MAG: phosphoenolpyruvate carboxylase [unclassified Hahellaceae]|mgnify:CR=1 FL=1|nr:phosphoenolpyruvate carboxylase [Hahellaceae bacterium]|tara:strand:- start:29474 stop:32224 length:2751 start_codon:yes stop_codon:yes gene_type:complete